MATPKQWWLCRIDGKGKPTSAARGYWPADTLVEVWNPVVPQWTARDILEDVNTDPDWISSNQKTVEAWVASHDTP